MMDQSTHTIGIFTTDTALIVRTWDAWLAQVTGISADAAQGQPLTLLVANLQSRGILGRFQQVLEDGVVVVLAPALHGYVVPCAPTIPARHFEQMQQHVTIAPLRDQEQIVGTLVTVEDVTARRERERDLEDNLADPDEQTRLRAAQALADETEAPAQMLINTLGDSSWRVRQAAVSSLSQRTDSEIVAQLVRALHDDHRNPSVLNSALQALAFRQDDAIEPLVELLASPDADLRGYVVLALGEQHGLQAGTALVHALNDPDTNVRYHAIEALGKLKSTEAVDDLVAIAQSGEFFLAFPALDALARIGEPRAASHILPLLHDDLLSEPAASALGALGDVEVVAPLAAALNAPSAPTITIVQALASIYDRYLVRYNEGAAVVEHVQQALGPIGVRNLLDALLGVQPDKLPALARILGWLEGTEVGHALTRLLAQPAVRAEVVEALVRHGPSVVDLLIEQLDAEELETRQAAVVALGRIGSPKAVPSLIALLDEHAELASIAAGALAKIGDRRAFEPLLGMIGHSSAVMRHAAIGALNSLGHPELSARIGALLYAEDALVRESAVRVAGYFGYAAYVHVMAERCYDPDDRVRRAAIEHLPFVDYAGLLSVLGDGLRDQTPAVRVAAARAFAHVEDDQAVPALIGALQDQDAWVRYYAVRSLGQHRAHEAVDALQQLAQADSAAQVRIAALETLGQIGGERALAALLPFSTNPDIELASAAITALGAIDHPDAQLALLKLANTPDPARRIVAVEALGKQHGAAAVGPLQQLAKDHDAQLAQSAVAALAQMATPEAIDALVELLGEPPRRETVVMALSRLGEGTIELLGRGLAHQQPEVRRAVIEALERMKHRHASDYIGTALDDPEATVRLAAATALGRLGSQSAHRLLERLAQSDPDAIVRQAAHLALKR